MKIAILNLSIVPERCSKGQSPCKISYQGKATDKDRQAKVTYELSGDDDIWFLVDGKVTKLIGPKAYTFSVSGTNIIENFTILVKTAHESRIAFIKVQAIDQEGYQATEIKGIKYG
jgi:hypothetical protein